MPADSSSSTGQARDREAVEHVLGRPLGRVWPAAALAPGCRVIVIRDPLERWAPWQREFLGTIDDMAAPEPVRHPSARRGELAYWVSFDQPQHDSNGDGPYRKAQIWARFLRPMPTS
ncbi:ferrous iron transport protein A [Streptomyces sp. PCS3-D2]|uniref:ferrous iron transport protein A n=1 Tax=Streptomyces sp. PCS3-D2 TaxID=1460244 RepID=UPI00272B7CBB|nr:ferrous iron transport protein A [Streptomyces sp. PCS3-D2]WKV75419.1 ferrous iron transport protein A [Streptomyces sp. PCS3-D2]